MDGLLTSPPAAQITGPRCPPGHGTNDAQVLKKASTRRQDFEAQLTAQLSNMQSDVEKELSHLTRGASSMKPLDSTGPSGGLDTMANVLGRLRFDVEELKDICAICGRVEPYPAERL